MRITKKDVKELAEYLAKHPRKRFHGQESTKCPFGQFLRGKHKNPEIGVGIGYAWDGRRIYIIPKALAGVIVKWYDIGPLTGARALKILKEHGLA